MFEQELQSQDAGAASTIDQWKESVSRFFSGEWDNLRELICRLEEQDWDGVELTAPRAAVPPPAPRIRHTQDVASPPQPAAETAEQTRLDDLARRLERRLQEKSNHV